MKLILFPNASFFGMATDNRVAMELTQDADGENEHGKARTVVDDMPQWVAEGVVLGEQVGGTCLMCGHIIIVGADDVEIDLGDVTGTGDSLSPDAGGQGLEPGDGVSPGKRRHRGWGRQLHKHARCGAVIPCL